ncbi:hypothetical protein T07_8597 [Trichinella nelsoni]|uniref:Uncharacterized protein n=1 Tax=Trichinella nelsoni TaxID=6336 RepID=A0A0V0SFJ1_9BILA|nr:hypothetical protein T07_8597 [Trichinella nelsoni]
MDCWGGAHPREFSFRRILNFVRSTEHHKDSSKNAVHDGIKVFPILIIATKFSLKIISAIGFEINIFFDLNRWLFVLGFGLNSSAIIRPIFVIGWSLIGCRGIVRCDLGLGDCCLSSLYQIWVHYH